MKKIKNLVLLITLLLSAMHLYANPGIRVYFAHNTFWAPNDDPYLETYLQFDASSLRFVPVNINEYKATVEILLVFNHNDQIIEFRKYELNSPAVTDTLQTDFSFLDQQRFLLPAGSYQLDITLNDINSDSQKLNHTEIIDIEANDNFIFLSSIQLAERIEPAQEPGMLTKSGYNIYPYVDFFYPESLNAILFYTEVYNVAKALGENEGFLITSSVESFETRRVLSDYTRFKRENAKQVNVLLNTKDISSLPTGNYFLVVDVRNRNNEILASNRVFFQRSNPGVRPNMAAFQNMDVHNTFAEHIVNRDSLSYFLKALAPISSYTDREFVYNLANTGDIRKMQQYFYHFWLQRDPLNPAEAWKNYYIELCRADANFRTMVRRGYATDRGRIYLQYGPPNSINKDYDDPAAYPYEIWHYYSINGQSNKRFVFYSRDIATNDFNLIHSDMRGEIYNPRWKTVVVSRKEYWQVDYDEDQRRPWDRTWGSRIHDYYAEPR